MDLVLAVTGLALLLGSGDALVRGAVALSLRLGVPTLIISLTVIAFGTSAPEMLVSVNSALQGAPGIAYGNVIGSNIANVLLVLGVPALIYSIDGRDCRSMRSFGQMILASVLFILLCFLGPLYIWQGALLLAYLTYMLTDAYFAARKARRAGLEVEIGEDDLEDADPDMANWKLATLLAVGVVGLPVGAHLLIEGARGMAQAAGISETAIGLTLVALGTSLPELATTVVAAMRKEADVAIGNVIGSNLFNLTAIMGVASFFGPLPAPPSILQFDLWIMLASSVLLAPFVMGRLVMTRGVGLGFLVAYFIFLSTALAP